MNSSFFIANLKLYSFPPKTSEEEKIIFAKTHNYSVRQINESFGFGNHKIGKVCDHYKQTKTIPEPSKRSPKQKLTPEVMMNIDDIISQNAHSTLNSIRQKSFIKI